MAQNIVYLSECFVCTSRECLLCYQHCVGCFTSFRSNCFSTIFSVFYTIANFLFVLSITEIGVLKSEVIAMDLLISPFSSISFYFLYFEETICQGHSCSGLLCLLGNQPLIIMGSPCLPLVIFLILKFTLFYINIPLYQCLYSIFFISFNLKSNYAFIFKVGFL